tara:strand:- start:189 stop:845 length:657 start_codon:yes stop_codon:yes gene_type:complete
MVTRKRCKVCNLDNREEIEVQLETMVITTDELDRQMNWSSGTTARHQRNHMGEYFDASNPQCNICTHEIRGLIEQQLQNGEVTPQMIATVAECTEEQVKRHMRKHLQPLVQKAAASIIAVKEVDEIESLTKTINRLEEKIDILFDQDEMHPKYVDSLTKLAKEIRESLRYLMEFKGKLVHKRQDTIIVAQMQIVQEVLAQNHPQVWLDVKSKMEERMV